jgi:hypothetical protein
MAFERAWVVKKILCYGYESHPLPSILLKLCVHISVYAVKAVTFISENWAHILYK